MSVIPVRLPPQEVHIHADRRLVFQVITAFGASQGIEEGASQVLRREDDGRLLVEFHTPGPGLFGRRKVYRTVERVTLHEPERVEFDGVEGPLSLLRDRFTLEADGNCTQFRYESEVGLRWWLLGWLVTTLYVRPLLRRMMRQHLEELKDTIEARAKRSKVYPQGPCDQEQQHDAA